MYAWSFNISFRLCLAERRKFSQIRHIRSCWWRRKTSVTCWCWSLNGRRQTAGLRQACWRWFPLGGLAAQMALTWRFTKSALERARRNKSELQNIKGVVTKWCLSARRKKLEASLEFSWNASVGVFMMDLIEMCLLLGFMAKTYQA